MFVYKAKEIGVFDNVCGYSEFDVTEELAKTKMFKQERGGGYWTWKPDIIYTAMQQMQDGDILVYCDAGCTLQQSKEWSRIWKKLENMIYMLSVYSNEQTDGHAKTFLKCLGVLMERVGKSNISILLLS